MAPEDIDRAERDGAAPYSPRTLAIYDFRVLWFNLRFVWRCAAKHVLALYDREVSADHLDIGPGTGWFLCRATYPTALPRVTLIDLNPNSLATASGRLRQRGIASRTLEGSVLQPLPVDGHRFGSVSATHLMHCVPGGWDTKGEAFRHIAAATAEDGVFFGATVLASGVPHTALSRYEMRRYQTLGAFHNEHDDLDGLVAALERAFESVEVRTRGSMALWTARRPR
ncbi:class I SAM-dependent methyltransferase [Nocardia pseudobrasiliensis]|uniref:Methyltransferase family protein n=1 Tax=Nocardia pseudobrasiliensis TaxID=45979 RepID=A0A370HXH9_9NOCA|nr:class I SAM-dependent methyltransferase [Nocardia pseudobrasiliensis]RDI63203.1 methyltransferase family protein [Nocardia pseudobrasiliensis]